MSYIQLYYPYSLLPTPYSLLPKTQNFVPKRTAIVNLELNYGKLNTIEFGKLEFSGQLMRYAHAT
ncbi:MAG: hypothetical protein F6K56_41370 [Moorea sp. SIO3G5]|nr:hypothetical protein [Moorena sp. SIO3G5]